jgi:hypothetical protein
MSSYLIPAQNVESLKAQFATLVKKAIKVSAELPTLIIGVVQMVEKKDDNGNKFFAEYFPVEVTGTAPKLSGWTFNGTLETLEGTDKTIVRSIPDAPIPDRFRYVNASNCDHCGVNRFRLATFVVSNGTEYKQVGRSCLKDFLGHANPDQIASYAQYLSSMDFGGFENESGGYVDPLFETVNILSAAVNLIKAVGYRKSEYENSTKGDIISHLLAKKQSERLDITADDIATAELINAWLITKSGSEFWDNLSAYAGEEYVKHKAIGYLAAGAMMYLKEVEAIKVFQSKKDGISNDPIAPIDTKVKVEGIVVSAHRFERAAYHYGDSGISQVLVIKTNDNKLIKMFSANLNITQDSTVTISGKIGNIQTETFEKSPFKGCNITTMAPRSRITI